MPPFRRTGLCGVLLLTAVFGAGCGRAGQPTAPDVPAADPCPDLEAKLAPLAQKLGEPRPGEWLAEHPEPGQSFEQYRAANPVRRSPRWNTLYLCLIGEFTPEQEQVLDLTREYLALVYDVPVKVRKRMPLDEIPDRARRTHPTWGDRQILTDYVLGEVLKPDRPDDALGYLAFTASDLWPASGLNFVLGQANLRDRTGIWSIYRKGDPSRSPADFRRCLRRTLATASHETGHILTLQHCTAYQCGMNGSNSVSEAARRPLHFCPVCLHKLCWNLQVEPMPYLERLEKFCRAHDLADEADWYARAVAILKGEN